jgi:hypothetical protein
LPHVPRGLFPRRHSHWSQEHIHQCFGSASVLCGSGSSIFAECGSGSYL